MPYHSWGDDDFDFNGLNKAGKWIETFYRRAAKQQMHWKEKYGTLRYEFICLWIKDNEQSDKFFNILYRATKKFPDYSGEIVSDIVPCMTNNPRSQWYKGYFEAVLWIKHKSRWC